MVMSVEKLNLLGTLRDQLESLLAAASDLAATLGRGTTPGKLDIRDSLRLGDLPQ
jgi:hypothetical protein